MRLPIVLASTIAVGWPIVSTAQTTSASIDVPAWLFPLPAQATTVTPDSVLLRRVPGSQAAFTEARLADRFDVADWHPESHPAMPDIVAHGRKSPVFACAYCHLPDGSGRPENAMLAGLPVAYIEQEVAYMKSGARHSAWRAPYSPSDNMRQVAYGATAKEVAEAARYFSRLPARQRSRVVETATIPRAEPALGVYVPARRGGVEPLGQRLIEMPADPLRHELRDPLVGYVAYVPPGSIARGRVIATEGSLDTPPCVSCHGPGLGGVAPEAPPLAGRFPSYVLRQLIAFRTGARSTPASTPMGLVAATLTLNDMIAAAAYAGSLSP
ncbi:MAG TPA: hypothetical protein VNW46_18310 [Gemmatimonadaceae bacterium]|jgi:cytochrome c553|nr:hypothetical protein [Gemmatimonadaceae bacterium]